MLEYVQIIYVIIEYYELLNNYKFYTNFISLQKIFYNNKNC